MSVRVITVIAALVTIPAYAQDPPRTINARDLQSMPDVQVPHPPDPPAGKDAWSLRVHTAGGFTGQGIGSVTISSNGQVGCGPAPCATPVSRAFVSSVTMALQSIREGTWISRPPSGLCSDCVRTTVALKRREGDIVRTYVATWDDSQPPTPEMRELRRLAFELRDTRSAQR